MGLRHLATHIPRFGATTHWKGLKYSKYIRQTPWGIPNTVIGYVRSLFVQAQPTPNPKSKKLIPGKEVLESGSMDFQSKDEAKRSPLARRIFSIEGVTGVFFGTDFLTVTVKEEEIWSNVQADVFTVIREFYEDGKPILDNPSDQPNDAGTAILESDSSTVCVIKDLLEERIRPTVQDDGGDIAFRGFENGTVYVELRGSCVGCPSSSVTPRH
ncbi:hypothetical protein AAMO2058_001070000 [Amorphochlora amoebiformis]